MSAGDPVLVRCLVVDDVEENLIALTALLRQEGVEIHRARSGREALELLLLHDFALAMIDVQMPEMDGYELAELMRGTERTKHVPIIFVTARSSEEARLFRAYDAGAVDFLFKPIDERILRHKATTFFELYRQKQLLRHQLELLRESEEFRTRLFESSHDCIAVLDEHGKISFMSGEGSRPFVEAQAPDRWSAWWIEEQRAAADECVSRAKAGEAVRFTGECLLMAGASTWWDFSLAPVKSADGTVNRVLATGREVTEQRRAAAEVERMAHELKETLRLNETFVAALSHDLRNPLSVIVTGVEVLRNMVDRPAERRTVEALHNSSQRMTSMIDQLFDLARVRLGGGIPINRTPLVLAELSLSVAKEIEAASGRQVALEASGDTRGAWDSDYISRVLSNLILNAVRHGDSAAPIVVSIDGRSPEQIRIDVQNGGVIPPAVLPTIFEPFKKGTKANAQGLGLGLYIVQQIVLSHGGRIEVRSTPEIGTHFTVVLPRI